MLTSCRREMNPSLQPSLTELIQQQQQNQQIRPHQSLNNHLSNHRSNSTSNNDTNNILLRLDSNPNNNLIDYNNPFYLGNQTNPITSSSSGLHLGGMDIEYFENTLAQFDFSLPPTSSQLSTPSQSAAVHFDTNDGQLINSANPTNGIMTPTSSYYPNSNNTNNHMLDLFNIDDFKMSGDSLPWSEVDYAV